MLSVSHLTKKYDAFTLRDVSFTLEKGYIMGFIGANGAGKSTTMKCMLNLAKADEGKVEFFNKQLKENEQAIKQDIGFMLEPFDYYKSKKIKTIANIYKKFFTQWNDNVYYDCLKRFSLDENKRVKELSAGMKVKLSLSFALSHNAKLFILDEPTSGLDPVAREDLLDIFRDIIADGEHSIFFSTHITSDLDKSADYIVLLSHGKVLLNATKDDIIESHKLIKGTNAQFTPEISAHLIGTKKTSLGFSGLIQKDSIDKSWGLIEESPNLEDIMLYYERGKKENITL